MVFIGIVVAAINGCKDDNDIGLKILPSVDQLTTKFCDTTTIQTFTQADDSLRSDKLSLQLIGVNTDPVFGTCTANVYSQLNLEGTPAFGTSPVADSMVLVMYYSGYYGDTSTSQTIDVIKVNQDMHIDSTYYANQLFPTDSLNPIGTSTFFPHPLQVDSFGTDIGAQIRIPIDIGLANTFLTTDPANYASNDAWLVYFQGLYLRASHSSGAGAISYFNFFSSKVDLYFHNSTSTGLVYTFSLQGARVNSFIHDYTGTPVSSQLNGSIVTDSLNYVQATSGIKMKITFPFLKHFTDSGSIVVNRAELKISAVAGDPIYTLPANMYLVTKSEAGTVIFPVDYYESTGYYGGAINATSDGYTFNIARQIQQFLNGTTTISDFYLVVSGSGVLANRVIVRNENNTAFPLKLSLYYTKLK